MSALPRSIVSRSVLAEGARRAVNQASSRAEASLIADLRRDAWGHGLRETAHALADAGARQVLVDDEAAAAAVNTVNIDITTNPNVCADLDGATLFGLPNSEGNIAGTPAMRLVGRVMSIKTVHAGAGVSYGYTYRASHASRLALVTGGYAQGIVRALGNQARVDIAGESFPIVGRIAMDVSVIDIGDANVLEGSAATYFGAGTARTALHDWHRVTGFTTAELVTVAGLRTLREWSA